jgi:hypothetical protein
MRKNDDGVIEPGRQLDDFDFGKHGDGMQVV